MGSDFERSASVTEFSSLLQITSQLPLWKSACPLYYIISYLWARSNISGTARSAEAQYYSLACDQFSNDFARQCWAPNNRMCSANWSNSKLCCPEGIELRLYIQSKASHHRRHLNENIYSNSFCPILLHFRARVWVYVIKEWARSSCWLARRYIRVPACV